MGLESAKYVGELDSGNPVSGDLISYGDDHLRLIKDCLQRTFAGIGGAALVFGTDSTNSGSYSIAPTPSLTRYDDGMVVMLYVANSNTGAVTLDINALGATGVKNSSGVDFGAGEFGGGRMHQLVYYGGVFYSVDAEGAIPKGSVLTFYQASAPSGWTQNTALNDRMLRVVSSAGGGIGGTDSPIASHSHTYTGVIAHTHTFTTGSSGAHTHYTVADNIDGVGNDIGGNEYIAEYTSGSPDGDSNRRYRLRGTSSVANTGITTSNGVHYHTGSTDNTGSTSANTQNAFSPKYADVIICSKD